MPRAIFRLTLIHNKVGSESPIASECQANYMVYTTDGEGDDLRPEMVNDITGSSSCSLFAHHEAGGGYGQHACVSTVVNWLLNNDQHPGLPDARPLLPMRWVFWALIQLPCKIVASADGGNYYDAGSSVAGIVSAFKSIIQDAITENSVSFTNAAFSINSANKNDDNYAHYFQ